MPSFFIATKIMPLYCELDASHPTHDIKRRGQFMNRPLLLVFRVEAVVRPLVEVLGVLAQHYLWQADSEL